MVWITCNMLSAAGCSCFYVQSGFTWWLFQQWYRSALGLRQGAEIVGLWKILEFWSIGWEGENFLSFLIWIMLLTFSWAKIDYKALPRHSKHSSCYFCKKFWLSLQLGGLKDGFRLWKACCIHFCLAALLWGVALWLCSRRGDVPGWGAAVWELLYSLGRISCQPCL